MALANVVIYVLMASLTAVTADRSYTRESKSGNGNECLSDCIGYRCQSAWTKTNETCIPGDKPALKYYTARNSQKDFCVSRCGKFGYSYNWCYVSDTEWDHCDPVLRKYVTTTDFSHTKGPCVDKCNYRRGSFLSCNTHWGSWDYCNREEISYIQSRTVEGMDCVGVCGTHNETYNWCYYEIMQARHWSRCTPPPRDVAEYEKLTALVKRVSLSKKNAQCLLPTDLLREKRQIGCEPVEAGFVNGFAQTFEQRDSELLTVSLYDHDNPVYRYTIVPRAYNDEPVLPLVVRAGITRQTLRQAGAERASLHADVRRNLERLGLDKDRLDNNDDIGHLVGYRNGGPNEIYNLAPQSRRPGCPQGSVCQQQSVWHSIQAGIESFVRETGGVVNMTIVVVYKDLRSYTRPDGFAVNLVMYNPNGTVHHECNDHYFTNDPESDTN